MLKISEGRPVKQGLSLRLEGRVVGPWVRELRQICEPLLADGSKLTIDLSDVSFADEKGVILLVRFKIRGIQLINPTPFVEEQLKAVAEAQLKT